MGVCEVGEDGTFSRPVLPQPPHACAAPGKQGKSQAMQTPRSKPHAPGGPLAPHHAPGVRSRVGVSQSIQVRQGADTSTTGSGMLHAMGTGVVDGLMVAGC